jgi:hypothetical protein
MKGKETKDRLYFGADVIVTERLKYFDRAFREPSFT